MGAPLSSAGLKSWGVGCRVQHTPFPPQGKKFRVLSSLWTVSCGVDVGMRVGGEFLARLYSDLSYPLDVGLLLFVSCIGVSQTVLRFFSEEVSYVATD